MWPLLILTFYFCNSSGLAWEISSSSLQSFYILIKKENFLRIINLLFVAISVCIWAKIHNAPGYCVIFVHIMFWLCRKDFPSQFSLFCNLIDFTKIMPKWIGKKIFNAALLQPSWNEVLMSSSSSYRFWDFFLDITSSLLIEKC